MPNVADVKLFWTRSPSPDVVKVVVFVTNDGTETSAEFGPEIQEMMIVVKPRGTVQFRIDSYDSEGNTAASETYTFVLGDLEAPFPATGLGHEITAVHPETPTPTP